MGAILDEAARAGLERSGGVADRPRPSGDWLRRAPAQPGLERIEARFAGHAYDPHRHDTYAVGCTLDGVQTFDYRGARVDSTPGDAIVLHPDERHNGRAGAAGGFRYRMLYVEPSLVRGALGGRAAALPFVRAPVQAGARRLLAALRPALAELDRGLEAIERDGIVATLADALLELDPSAARGRRSPACDRSVERARGFLDAHFDRTVASEEFEALTGLDRHALARAFRARLGTSPYRYLTMRRLARARSAILAGHPIADAALASGFADQSHMTRQFRRAFGLPPGRWRALQLAGQDAPPDPRDRGGAFTPPARR